MRDVQRPKIGVHTVCSRRNGLVRSAWRERQKRIFANVPHPWVLGSGFWVLGSGFWVLGSGDANDRRTVLLIGGQ